MTKRPVLPIKLHEPTLNPKKYLDRVVLVTKRPVFPIKLHELSISRVHEALTDSKRHHITIYGAEHCISGYTKVQELHYDLWGAQNFFSGCTQI